MGTIIYGLTDPRDGHLRYVGKTSGSAHTRRLAHISDVKRGRVYIPRHKWISELLSIGLEPEIFEIDIVQGSWQEAEQFWIGYFRFIGCDLLNATAGGDGLCSFRTSEETRSKQRAAALARYKKAGERARTGRSVSNAFKRPEVRKNLSAGRKKVSRESIQKCVDALVRKARSPEGRAATSARNLGKVLSPDARAKISAANTGRKWTPERRKAFSAFRIGKTHTPETRSKMVSSAILREARKRG